jgi:inhibitor of cysteine peptidase
VAEVILDETNQGTAMKAHVGDQIIVKLREIPTSGYRWMPASSGDDVLTLSVSEFTPGPGSTLGGGGYRVLTFRARGAGVSKIELDLRRPWEQGEGSAVEHYQAEVVVT